LLFGPESTHYSLPISVSVLAENFHYIFGGTFVFGERFTLLSAVQLCNSPLAKIILWVGKYPLTSDREC